MIDHGLGALHVAGLLAGSILSLLAGMAAAVPVLGAQTSSGVLEGVIVDAESEAPLAARVYVTGSDSRSYFDPAGVHYERPWGPEQNIGTTGAHFTTIGNRFKVSLPAGEIRVVVERGKEYVPYETRVSIEPGKTLSLRVPLERWIDMADRGWYSGDTHVHRTLPELLQVLPAEDLNLSVIQTQWNTAVVSQEAERWIAKADSDGLVWLDATHGVNVLGGEIEDWQGIGALSFILPGAARVPLEGVDDFYNALQYVAVGRQVREAGGIVEIEKPWWRDAPVHAALAGATLVGILNNHVIRDGFLPEIGQPRTSLGPDYPAGELGYLLYNFDLYYQYLNAGLPLKPTAGSASGVLPNPPGFNRVYVRVDGEFSYRKWLQGLKAGRSFVSNGPMLIVRAGGDTDGDGLSIPRPGPVEVRGTVHSPNPLARIEIVRNGDVVKTLRPTPSSGDATEFVAEVEFEESGWLAVRCFEKKTLNHRTAHTAPVHVTVAGRPFVPTADSVLRIIRHIEGIVAETAAEPVDTSATGHIKSEEHRKETIAMYRQALDHYRALMPSER